MLKSEGVTMMLAFKVIGVGVLAAGVLAAIVCTMLRIYWRDQR